MAQSTLTKFTAFATEVGLQSHQLNTDEIRVALTNTLPVISQTVFDAVTNHPPPAAANNYPAGGADITNLFSAGKMTGTDVVFTATAGGIGPFRYAVLYNYTNASKKLIGWYDYGAAITLGVGETFTVDFDPSTGILTIT